MDQVFEVVGEGAIFKRGRLNGNGFYFRMNSEPGQNFCDRFSLDDGFFHSLKLRLLLESATKTIQ